MYIRGGGKGGSDFDPKGKSEGEIRRFCQAFMTELFRYVDASTDVPAGDIGVGGREIGYMCGQYSKLTNKHGEGVLTGKPADLGGSPLRPQATGYGLVYITELAVQRKMGRSLQGMRCGVSGSGNVAQYAVEKLLQLGAKVLTMSDSSGVMVFPDGMTMSDWEAVMDCKNNKRERLSSLEGKVSGKYIAGQTPWSMEINYDLALPCATQNEINADDAKRLVKNGVLGVLEGANLPTNMQGQQVFRDHQIIYIPGKAANAGGVGVSGLEMAQNAQRLTWKPEEVDIKLRDMMTNIYNMMEEAEGHGVTLEAGANRAGFLKVVNGAKALGWVF